YRVLARKDGLGQRMAKVLGYDVTKAKECLACHGVALPNEKVRKASFAVHFDVNEGISCAVCHGPHREWIAAHGIMVTAARLRAPTGEKREVNCGMYTLHAPVGRAELCASCHVGNLHEGKFVTHEMYAAGPPPLPGFEAATFSNSMPRHWRYMHEKSEALQKE